MRQIKQQKTQSPIITFHDDENEFYNYGKQMKFSEMIEKSGSDSGSSRRIENDASVKKKNEDMSFMKSINETHRNAIYGEIGTEC